MTQPWYSDGLKFSCTGCGGCCSGEPGYVWVDGAEIGALADALGLTADEFERKYVRAVGTRRSLFERAGGDCVLLDESSRKCRVYAARPRQCRTWPFWASNLASPAAWKATADLCPGCNRGQHVSYQTMRELVQGSVDV